MKTISRFLLLMILTGIMPQNAVGMREESVTKLPKDIHELVKQSPTYKVFDEKSKGLLLTLDGQKRSRKKYTGISLLGFVVSTIGVVRDVCEEGYSVTPTKIACGLTCAISLISTIYNGWCASGKTSEIATINELQKSTREHKEKYNKQGADGVEFIPVVPAGGITKRISPWNKPGDYIWKANKYAPIKPENQFIEGIKNRIPRFLKNPLNGFFGIECEYEGAVTSNHQELARKLKELSNIENGDEEIVEVIIDDLQEASTVIDSEEEHEFINQYKPKYKISIKEVLKIYQERLNKQTSNEKLEENNNEDEHNDNDASGENKDDDYKNIEKDIAAAYDILTKVCYNKHLGILAQIFKLSKNKENYYEIELLKKELNSFPNKEERWKLAKDMYKEIRELEIHHDSASDETDLDDNLYVSDEEDDDEDEGNDASSENSENDDRDENENDQENDDDNTIHIEDLNINI